MHAFDSYQLMTSQLGYQQLNDEDVMILQSQASECRCKISEVVWLLSKYMKIYNEKKIQTDYCKGESNEIKKQT